MSFDRSSRLQAANAQSKYYIIADQVISGPFVIDTKLFSIYRKSAVDCNGTGSCHNCGGEGNRFSHPVKLQVASHCMIFELSLLIKYFSPVMVGEVAGAASVVVALGLSAAGLAQAEIRSIPKSTIEVTCLLAIQSCLTEKGLTDFQSLGKNFQAYEGDKRCRKKRPTGGGTL
jgi:hypothetical protein